MPGAFNAGIADRLPSRTTRPSMPPPGQRPRSTTSSPGRRARPPSSRRARTRAPPHARRLNVHPGELECHPREPPKGFHQGRLATTIVVMSSTQSTRLRALSPLH